MKRFDKCVPLTMLNIGCSGWKRHQSVDESDQNKQTEVPPPSKAADPNVDAFRLGYNIGMLSVQLETVKMKLEDNKELVTTQFASASTTSRDHHESLLQTLSDNRRLIGGQLGDSVGKVATAVHKLSQEAEAHQNEVRRLLHEKNDTLQRHLDDRMENIKDTVKVTFGVLLVLQMWILILFSTRQYYPPSAPSPTVSQTDVKVK